MVVGDTTNYMIFFGLQESSGTYTTGVHRSSVTCNQATSIYYKDSKVYGLCALGTSTELFIYNTNEDSFEGIYNFGLVIGFNYISVPATGK
jgi:hypothetical protein